jgi:hypothetical protein
MQIVEVIDEGCDIEGVTVDPLLRFDEQVLIVDAARRVLKAQACAGDISDENMR